MERSGKVNVRAHASAGLSSLVTRSALPVMQSSELPFPVQPTFKASIPLAARPAGAVHLAQQPLTTTTTSQHARSLCLFWLTRSLALPSCLGCSGEAYVPRLPLCVLPPGR